MNNSFKKSKRIFMSLALSLAFTGILSNSILANDISRTRGKNRYETSVEVSKRCFNSSDYVVISSGEKFSDALCSGVLANKLGSSLLLVGQNHIPNTVEKELERLNTKNIIVVGGEQSVSNSVFNKLKEKYSVNRMSGKDRSETSIVIGKYLKDNYKVESYGIANGNNFTDSLASTPYLDKTNSALIILNGNKTNSSIDELLNNKKVVVFGGEKSISNEIVDKYNAQRISGNNKYNTAINIAKIYNDKNENYILVDGNDFSDGISATTLSKKLKAPIIFNSTESISTVLKNNNAKVEIVGGINSISSDIEAMIRNINSSDETNKEKTEARYVSGTGHRHNKNKSLANNIYESSEKNSNTSKDLDLSKENSKETNKENNIVKFEDDRIRKEVASIFTDGNNLFDPSKTIGYKQVKTFYPTKEDMKNIKRLNISYIIDEDGEPITPKSIKGIEYAINAEIVSLNGLGEGLDISILNSFKNMKELSLSSDKLTNIDFLKNIDNLKKLDISRNNIIDISIISKYNDLEYLFIDNNKIKNIDAIKTMKKLKDLTAYNNNISDISPLEKLEELKKIELSGNEIKSIEKIGEKPLLEELYLTGEYTKPFETPKMIGNCIEDITPLKNMKNLRLLFLQDTRLIKDLTPLKNLKKLENMTLRNNQIEDVTPLSELTNLKVLYLYKNKVKDISSLKNLTKMTEFNFAVNEVKDMDVVKNMTDLEILMVYSNKITDLNPVKDLKSIYSFNAHRNNIVDFSPLKTFLEEDRLSGVVLDAQEITIETNPKKVEYKTTENDINVLITIENPITDFDGTKFKNFAEEEFLEINKDTTNEMKYFYNKYNEAMAELKKNNITVKSSEDNLIITIPKKLYSENGVKLKIPFYRAGEFEGMVITPVGGIIDLTIK